MLSKKKRISDLLILAALAALLVVGSVFMAGCGGTPVRADILQSPQDLPPADHMSLEKLFHDSVTINRGDVIELTYMAAVNSYQTIGPVTFLGVEPETKLIGLLSESGEKLAIPSDAVQTVVRVMESGLRPQYEISADHWRIAMPASPSQH